MAYHQYVVLLALMLSASIHQVAAAYSCSPTTCVPPNCFCAGQASPLPIDQTPQFILFTHDDATGPVSVPLMAAATEDIKNPNNCTIPSTFFTMQSNTECEWVKAAWQAGNEIATHTVSHLAMPTGFTGGVGSIEAEIVGVRDFLVNNCSIPAEDVVGFRSPYLAHHPGYRQALSANGFLYDSTINEHWPMPTSPSGEARLWPYTMDAGIPQDCSWTSHVCLPTESYPGMWEVPVWVVQTANYPDPAYAMDYCDGTSGTCDTLTLLKANFNQTYNGNRAPFPYYIHSPWLEETKQMAATKAFFQWVTSTYSDVYFVTMHQMLQWIANPVPKSQMNEWLGCVPGGRAAGASGAAARAAAAPVPAPEAAPVIEAPVQPVPEPAPVVATAQVATVQPEAPSTAAPTTPTASAASSAAQRSVVGLFAVVGAIALSFLQ